MGKLPKVKEKIKENTQPNKNKKQRLDTDNQSNVIGLPSTFSNVHQDSYPNREDKNDFQLYNMSNESNKRRRKEKEMLPAGKEYYSSRHTFQKDPSNIEIGKKGSFSSQKIRKDSEKDSDICLTTPEESKRKVKIIRRNVQPYRIESGGILNVAGPSRLNYTNKERVRKQVSFADEDAIYGTTPESSSSESNESLSCNKKYYQTSYRVQEVENPNTVFTKQSFPVETETEPNPQSNILLKEQNINFNVSKCTAVETGDFKNLEKQNFNEPMINDDRGLLQKISHQKKESKSHEREISLSSNFNEIASLQMTNNPDLGSRNLPSEIIIPDLQLKMPKKSRLDESNIQSGGNLHHSFILLEPKDKNETSSLQHSENNFDASSLQSDFIPNSLNQSKSTIQTYDTVGKKPIVSLNPTSKQDEEPNKPSKHSERKRQSTDGQQLIKDMKMTPRYKNINTYKKPVTSSRKFLLNNNKNNKALGSVQSRVGSKGKFSHLTSSIPKPSLASRENNASVMRPSSSLFKASKSLSTNRSGSILATFSSSIPAESNLNEERSVTKPLEESLTVKDLSIKDDTNHNGFVSNLSKSVPVDNINKPSVEIANLMYTESREGESYKNVPPQSTVTVINTVQDNLEPINKNEINVMSVSRETVANPKVSNYISSLLEKTPSAEPKQDQTIYSTSQTIPSPEPNNFSFESSKKSALYEIDSRVTSVPTKETIQDVTNTFYDDSEEKVIQNLSNVSTLSDIENKKHNRNINYTNFSVFPSHINKQTPFLNVQDRKKTVEDEQTESLYKQEGSIATTSESKSTHKDNKFVRRTPNTTFNLFYAPEIKPEDVSNLEKNVAQDDINKSSKKNSKSSENGHEDALNLEKNYVQDDIDTNRSSKKKSKFSENGHEDALNLEKNDVQDDIDTNRSSKKKSKSSENGREDALNLEKNEAQDDFDINKSSKKSSTFSEYGPKGLLIFVNKKTTVRANEFDDNREDSGRRISPSYRDTIVHPEHISTRKSKQSSKRSIDKSGKSLITDGSYGRDRIISSPDGFQRKSESYKSQHTRKSSSEKRPETIDSYSRKSSPTFTSKRSKMSFTVGSDKAIIVDRSPSGNRITQKYPCGCLRIITIDPDNELETEEFISDFCKDGSLCEIQRPELQKTIFEVPPPPSSIRDPSLRKRFSTSHSRCLLSNIEIIADGIISKKKIPERPPAPTMRGANLTGSINIKSDRLNGIFNFYIDPRLLKYFIENIDEVQKAIEDHIQD